MLSLVMLNVVMLSVIILSVVAPTANTFTKEYDRWKYHCTVDLLFDWFGLACFANKSKNCQLSYS